MAAKKTTVKKVSAKPSLWNYDDDRLYADTIFYADKKRTVPIYEVTVIRKCDADPARIIIETAYGDRLFEKVFPKYKDPPLLDLQTEALSALSEFTHQLSIRLSNTRWAAKEAADRDSLKAAKAVKTTQSAKAVRAAKV